MTNRLDNMTKEERKEAFREADKIRTNHIISQCCSVDDLRCSLRNSKPEMLKQKQEYLDELWVAIKYEHEHRGRVTIVNMLNAKWKSIQKSIQDAEI